MNSKSLGSGSGAWSGSQLCRLDKDDGGGGGDGGDVNDDDGGCHDGLWARLSLVETAWIIHRKHLEEY